MSIQKLRKAARNPSAAWSFAFSRLRGELYRFYASLFRPNISIGRGFRLSGKLIIRGPGKVTFGDNVDCSMTVTPYTYHPDAHIRIGSGTFLNGTRFGCRTEISVGEHGILADCRIMDSDFHSLHPFRRNDPALIKSAPVRIGSRVWLTTATIVLKGTQIGDHSTVTPNSVVQTDIPANSVAGGNPARVIRSLRPEEVASPDAPR